MTGAQGDVAEEDSIQSASRAAQEGVQFGKSGIGAAEA